MVFHALVEHELQVRNIPGIEPLGNFGLQKTGTRFETFQAKILLGLISHHGYMHFGRLHIAGNFDADNSYILDSRVLNLREDSQSDNLPNRLGCFEGSSRHGISLTRPAKKIKIQMPRHTCGFCSIRLESSAMRLYSAPMAGFTNYAHRELLRQFGGVDMIFTEMVSARSFAEMEKRGLEPPSRLWGIRDEARPLAVQIWDNEPATLANLAQKLTFDYGVRNIDLNFGCPAKQIAGLSGNGGGESGAYLLQFPDRIGDIVRKVADAAGTVPVTAKIRLGKTRDTINAIDVAQAVESAGGAGITIHGRTAADFYRGRADLEEIAKVKPKLQSIPLIGNGDIRTVEDALFCIRNYPVDGIMIGRASIAKPWLFRQIAQALRGEPIDTEPTGTQMMEMIHRNFVGLQRQHNESLALALIRKTVCQYAGSKPGARKFRNDVCTARDSETFFGVIKNFFETSTRQS